MRQSGFFSNSHSSKSKEEGTGENKFKRISWKEFFSPKNILRSKERILLLSSLLLSILIVVSFVLFIVHTNRKMAKMEEYYEMTGTAFRSELAVEREKLDFFEQNFYSLGSSVNDLRVLNALPEFSLPRWNGNTEDPEGTGEKVSAEAAIYSGIDRLILNIEREEALLRFNKILNNSELKEFMVKNDLKPGKVEDFSVKIILDKGDKSQKSPITVFVIRYNPNEKKIFVTSLWGDPQKSLEESFYEDRFGKGAVKWLSLKTDETKDLFSQWEEMNENVVGLYREESLKDSLHGKKIKSKRVVSKAWDEGELLTLTDSRDRPLLEWGVDTDSSLYYLWDAGEQQTFSEFDKLEEAVLKRAQELDNRLDFEVKAEKIAQRLEELYNDEAFNAYLHQAGLIPGKEMREDDDFYYFDLYYSPSSKLAATTDESENPDLSNKKAGMFGIQKSDAKIILMDEKGFPIKILTGREDDPVRVTANDPYSSNPNKSRLVPDYNVPGTVNILLIGRHSYATDSIMILHLDKRKNKGTLVSIPRDLYYKGRKLNNYYIIYGIDWLKKELSDITGLPISHYIMVDMYAFIDLIDMLGGIDVTLEEDLVDPTYKITDSLGNQKTLFYRSGTYHFSGREALRVARSRHGTSDYSRSARQQLILQGVKEALVDEVKGKSGRAAKLIEQMTDYVDTDIPPSLAVRYLLQYGNSRFSTGNTMSDKNVLYYSYSNIYRLSREKQSEALKDREFEKGSYILLPKGGDWNLIRKYLRDLLSEKDDSEKSGEKNE